MPLGNQTHQYGSESNIQMLYNQSGNITPTAQSILGQSNIINPLSQSPSIVPISSASSTPTPSTSNTATGSSNIIPPTTLHSIQSSPLHNKPQSPFHPPPSQHLPHHLAHAASNCIYFSFISNFFI